MIENHSIYRVIEWFEALPEYKERKNKRYATIIKQRIHFPTPNINKVLETLKKVNHLKN